MLRKVGRSQPISLASVTCSAQLCILGSLYVLESRFLCSFFVKEKKKNLCSLIAPSSAWNDVIFCRIDLIYCVGA